MSVPWNPHGVDLWVRHVDGSTEVVLNGEDITESCRGLDLSLYTDDLPVVRLELYVRDLSTDCEQVVDKRTQSSTHLGTKAPPPSRVMRGRASRTREDEEAV